MYLERLISNFNRQLPTPMAHTNQILVLSNNGQVINLMRGQVCMYVCVDVCRYVCVDVCM